MHLFRIINLQQKAGLFWCLSPPSQENSELFFEELSSCLSKASETEENFIFIIFIYLFILSIYFI